MMQIPKVFIKEDVYHKMQLWGKNCEVEVGGLLNVEESGNDFYVNDAYILKQEATGGDFKLDDNSTAEFMEKLISEDIRNLKFIKGWWHKHPCTGWSWHDDLTFESLRNYFGGTVLGLVMIDTQKTKLENGYYNILARVDFGKGDTYMCCHNLQQVGINVDNIDIEKIDKQCKQDVIDYVKIKRYNYKKSKKNNYLIEYMNINDSDDDYNNYYSNNDTPDPEFDAEGYLQSIPVTEKGKHNFRIGDIKTINRDYYVYTLGMNGICWYTVFNSWLFEGLKKKFGLPSQIKQNMLSNKLKKKLVRYLQDKYSYNNKNLGGNEDE